VGKCGEVDWVSVFGTSPNAMICHHFFLYAEVNFKAAFRLASFGLKLKYCCGANHVAWNGTFSFQGFLLSRPLSPSIMFASASFWILLHSFRVDMLSSLDNWETEYSDLTRSIRMVWLTGSEIRFAPSWLRYSSVHNLKTISSSLNIYASLPISNKQLLESTRMIDTENLTRKFGNLTAVDNVTLHVDEGEVFGFLGPNGAGKTTTVRMLCCLIGKTNGQAQIGNYSIDKSLTASKSEKWSDSYLKTLGYTIA